MNKEYWQELYGVNYIIVHIFMWNQVTKESLFHVTCTIFFILVQNTDQKNLLKNIMENKSSDRMVHQLWNTKSNTLSKNNNDVTKMLNKQAKWYKVLYSINIKAILRTINDKWVHALCWIMMYIMNNIHWAGTRVRQTGLWHSWSNKT